jgi:hypothetical protein
MEDTLRRIKSMKTNAKGWRPSRATGTSSIQSNIRAEMHTRLDCCLLEMFIGRPFILVHRRNQEGHTSSSQPNDQELLVQDCVLAAEEAIDLCYAMQTGDLGLTRSSYVEYSSCRAALLVLIAYSIFYRTNQFSARLQRGLDAIREMALTGDSARSEICLLETLEAALHHLHVFDRASEASAAGSGSAEKDTIRDDYEGFVKWYKNQVHASSSTDPRAAGPPISRTGDGSAAQPTAFTSVESSLRGATTTETQNNNAPSANDWFGSDFFTTGSEAAFFNVDYSQSNALEKDLLDSLLWIPD